MKNPKKQIYAIIAIMALAMINNIAHASCLSYMVHTGHKVTMGDISTWLNINWMQSFITVMVIDASVLILIAHNLRKQALVMACVICVFNFLYLDGLVDIYEFPQYAIKSPERVQGIIAKILFSVVFAYLVHTFGILIERIRKGIAIEQSQLQDIRLQYVMCTQKLETTQAELAECEIDFKSLNIKHDKLTYNYDTLAEKHANLEESYASVSHNLRKLEASERERIAELTCVCTYQAQNTNALSAHKRSCQAYREQKGEVQA